MQQSVLRNMSAVARAIALPGESEPQRFPSFPALERTSVLRFNAPFTWPVQSGGVRAMLTRQPAYPLWVEREPGTMRSYSLEWSTTPMPQYDNDANAFALMRATTGNTTSLLSCDVAATAQMTCGYPLLGLDHRTGPAPWTWVPPAPGASNYLVLGPGAGAPPSIAVSYRVVGQRWRPGGEIFPTYHGIDLAADSKGVVVSFEAGNATGFWWRPTELIANGPTGTRTGMDLPALSFHAIFAASTVLVTSGSTVTKPELFATVYNGTRSFLPAVKPVEFDNSSIPWSSTRCTAVSALFTNISKVLEKEGTVQWGRLNPDTIDVWNFKDTDLQVLHPSEKAFMGLETGTYSYVPPSTDQATFWDHTYSGQGTQVLGERNQLPVYRLDNNSLVCSAIFSDNDGGTNLAVNVDWHLEFRNVSPLFPIAMSTMSLESFHQSQLALVEAGFFYQNETHNKILNTVLSYVKKYASAAGLVHPMLGNAAKFVGSFAKAEAAPGKRIVVSRPSQKKVVVKRTKVSRNLAPKKNGGKPKATSGKRSGMS